MLRRQRLRVSNACDTCRRRKVKCDGTRPVCARCVEKRRVCLYDGAQVCFGPFTPFAPAHSLQTPPTSSKSSPPATWKAEPEQSDAGYTAHGGFAGQVAATINVRTGFASAPHYSRQVPFVDAPLFGELDLRSQQPESTEWPPRERADGLVATYWLYLDPLEPVLDRARFFHDFNASYSAYGAVLHCDPEVWTGIFYTVLALAVQRQESIPREERDGEANSYFKRAWASLKPETILWKVGSLEVVQCLILFNRYLHCTHHQRETWMTAGLAIRIAQTLGCHLLSPSSTADDDKKILKRRIWASCVGVDRCVAWSLGRTSAPSLISPPADSGPRWSLELHEIGNQVQLAQAQTRNSLAADLGLPHPYQQSEYPVVAAQLDAALDAWESRLPPDWQLHSIRDLPIDPPSRAMRYFLHLRHLHTRIFLHRPMLARYYSSRVAAAAAAAQPPTSLSNHLIKNCAASCILAAQRIVSLICESLSPSLDQSIPLLPWPLRIYYLHISATHFLAAMCTPDLFGREIERAWLETMETLRAHEHLTAYLGGCVGGLEGMASRISTTTLRPLVVRDLGVNRAATGGEGTSEGVAVTGGEAVDDEAGGEGMGFDFDEFFHDFDGMLFGGGGEEVQEFGDWR